ncbi:hypothetical protein FA15DRAFT_759211 [Coprinopsis marcescibilis]|uniref:Ubiquitin-like protease family profile domain-containing protein n=1 Tax=Coprinopsis marcescibilis TaxID=230819 RepID=A0A5C3KKF3_COPMA|nr:hypothetical protein FA15DRAFT_759211 [Coprinopsis marcescibilis]
MSAAQPLTKKKYSTRDLQPVRQHNRMGAVYSSPVKRHYTKRDKNTTSKGYVMNAKRRQLASKLDKLLKQACGSSPAASAAPTNQDQPNGGLSALPYHDHEQEETSDDFPDGLAGELDVEMAEESALYKLQSDKRKREKLTAAQKRQKEYDAWAMLLPDIARSYLAYSSGLDGCPRPPLDRAALETSLCIIEGCKQRRKNMKLMFFDRFEDCCVRYCDCIPLAALLMLQGMFPSSPLKAQYAFDVELLGFDNELFKMACVADTALAAALNNNYHRRGYYMKTKKGDRLLLDPFRKSLGHARQWADGDWGDTFAVIPNDSDHPRHASSAPTTSNASETGGESATPTSNTTIASSAPSAAPKETKSNTKPAKKKSKTESPPVLDPTTNTRTECDRILQALCPACFGDTKFGRTIKEGLDIHVAIDANFSHRHLRTKDDCPVICPPRFFLPKQMVDRVGDHIAAVRTTRKRKPPIVPDEAVDNCEESHQAGNGSNVKTNMDKFDDGGIAALVCRHDIPLILANVDTPGEQQKYAVAMLVRLFTLIPANATLSVLYDVGCVLDRSLQLYEILPDAITARMVWATSAMHAYAHQWSCQLVYNPRFATGFGLTDGEGVERLWSRMRKLIGICRTSLRGRRIRLLDRQAQGIAYEMKSDLGAWIRRRLKRKIPEHIKEGQKSLEECAMTIPQLREQWGLQREAQLSVRAHAPERLKKELDAVLRLQTNLEKFESSLEAAHAELARTHTSVTANTVQTLEETADKMRDEVEKLYSSIHVEEIYPELDGIDLKYVRKLLVVRDLKINIRKRAIGNMFEYDRLDQAAAGRHQALGTKIHQSIRSTIKARAPALQTAIRRFNKNCVELAAMNKPDWNIPTPSILPTSIEELRHDPVLLEDVWILPSKQEIPPWLGDSTVRQGIRGMLRQDRCLEEQLRLGWESDNLCRFFGCELRAIDLASLNDDNILLRTELRRRCSQHLYLQTAWVTPLASAIRFAAHVDSSLLGSAPPFGLVWTAPLTPNKQRPQATMELADDGATDEEDDDDQDDDRGEEDYNDEDKAGFNDIGETDTGQALLLDLFGEDPPTAERGPATATMSPISWTPVDQLSHDTTLIQDMERSLDSRPHSHPPEKARVVMDIRKPNRVRFQFTSHEMGMLTSNSWLNDECVNGIAALLLECSPYPGSFGLFSTHHLPMVQYDASDAEIWRQTRTTDYWKKSAWIFPIHLPIRRHWVLAIVYPNEQHILMFDSFGATRNLQQEVNSVVDFVGRLIRCARSRGLLDTGLAARKDSWLASPLVCKAVQTNGYDCGVWVLMVISAIFRGYHLPCLDESRIPYFRYLLYQRVLRLPVLATV